MSKNRPICGYCGRWAKPQRRDEDGDSICVPCLAGERTPSRGKILKAVAPKPPPPPPPRILPPPPRCQALSATWQRCKHPLGHYAGKDAPVPSLHESANGEEWAGVAPRGRAEPVTVAPSRRSYETTFTRAKVPSV